MLTAGCQQCRLVAAGLRADSSPPLPRLQELSSTVDSNEGVTRTCWLRGPFTSPYAVSVSYSNMILVASGIGITPAMGVLSQFGTDRFCHVIWICRSESMLCFFMPLLKDATRLVIYYTNKEKLSNELMVTLSRLANVAFHQNRPDISTLLAESIASSEPHERQAPDNNVNIEHSLWCALYCGGSKSIERQLAQSAQDLKICWECELFDW